MLWASKAYASALGPRVFQIRWKTIEKSTSSATPTQTTSTTKNRLLLKFFESVGKSLHWQPRQRAYAARPILHMYISMEHVLYKAFSNRHMLLALLPPMHCDTPSGAFESLLPAFRISFTNEDEVVHFDLFLPSGALELKFQFFCAEFRLTWLEEINFFFWSRGLS